MKSYSVSGAGFWLLLFFYSLIPFFMGVSVGLWL